MINVNVKSYSYYKLDICFNRHKIELSKGYSCSLFACEKWNVEHQVTQERRRSERDSDGKEHNGRKLR